MGKTTPLPDETIEVIKNTYARTGRYREAARAAGVSFGSAKKYADQEDDIEQLRAQKRLEVAFDVITKSAEAQEKLLASLIDPAKLREATVKDIATAYGIITDKLLLMRGEPTTRTEHTTNPDPASKLTPTEMNQLADLRDKLMAEVPG